MITLKEIKEKHNKINFTIRLSYILKYNYCFGIYSFRNKRKMLQGNIKKSNEI